MIGTLLLNRYELLEKIGEGGMGIVYKAKCTLLNRFVAVKILKSELSNHEDFISRFKREANSIASLSHPNIVNIHDVGIENNINFIVMEYVNGKTLKQIIKETVRLSTLNTLAISTQIAKALEYAHKNNIVHRDIKPDNILITEDNIVKLTDFGIAKVTDSVTITNSNNIIGSVHYFSPEQAKGKFVDCRADIYALGIVMYEMITGQVPFNSDNSISVVMMHIQEPVIPPKEVIVDIPENINKVILKALEKEPINRFQTANEIIEVLNAINENLNLQVSFNNKSIDDATVIMIKPDTVSSNTIIDSTVVLNQETIPETIVLKNDSGRISTDTSANKNKKIILTIGIIVLAIFSGLLWKILHKGTSADVKTTTSETAILEESVKSVEDDKKLVPSLIGNTQDIAVSTITNNGFVLGNITNEYSDTIPKGSVISQSPSVDTYYEKNGKIDLVISQGQKISPVVIQINEDNDDDDDDDEKDNEKNTEKETNGKAKGKDKKEKNNK